MEGRLEPRFLPDERPALHPENRIGQELRLAIEEVEKYERKLLIAAQRRSDQASRRIFATVLVSAILSVAVAIFLGLYLTRKLAEAFENEARSNAEAKRAIAFRDEFLMLASHELRTPVTSMHLQTDLLIKRLRMGDASVLNPVSISNWATTVQRQFKRLVQLIEEMLEVSRIEMKDFSVDRNMPVDLAELAREVVDRFTHIEKGVVCEVSIAADRSAGFAILEVRDQGIGIAPEHQEEIFSRFSRVHAGDNPGGLGLGLFISRKTIEAHEGRIEVSSALGQGSTFKVILPLQSG